jgi:6-bladed beta-propeller
MKFTRTRITGLLLLTALSAFTGCRRTDQVPLNEWQRNLCEKIRVDQSLERFLRAVDTIDLNIPLEVPVDLVPKVRFFSQGFVLFNPMARTIVVVSQDGRYLRTFGKIGSGPGEFRNLEVGAVDGEDNVYAFDDLLARVSVFTIDGVVLRTIPIRNPFLVRHMCVGNGGNLFLHHAPDSSSTGFVSVYDAESLKTCLVPPIEGFDSYYYRGHLEGELAASAVGDVFETNTFSYKISRIRPDLTVSQFGEEGDDYVALPPLRSFQTIQQLQRAVAGATIIRQLLLCDHGTLLLQETLRLRTVGGGVRREARVYDTAGVFLGALELSGESFEASDGHRLLRVHRNPPDDRGMAFDSKLPSFILFEVDDEPHGL